MIPQCENWERRGGHCVASPICSLTRQPDNSTHAQRHVSGGMIGRMRSISASKIFSALLARMIGIMFHCCGSQAGLISQLERLIIDMGYGHVKGDDNGGGSYPTPDLCTPPIDRSTPLLCATSRGHESNALGLIKSKCTGGWASVAIRLPK